jgi:hypothetical protein
LLLADKEFGLTWSDFNVKLVSVHDNWRKNFSENSKTAPKEENKN